jgi:hypothetical protein
MSALTPRDGYVIQNDSGMEIPARSVVVVLSVELTVATALNEPQMIFHIDQYGCGKSGNIMVTHPQTIKAGGPGYAFFDAFLYVSIDTTAADPAVGEEWGPTDGSWVISRGGKGFFAQGYSADGALPKRAMFLRTFVRAAATKCSSSSSSAASSSSDSTSSVSGSFSSSAGCGCITVVTAVSCGPGGLSVTTGQARGCC